MPHTSLFMVQQFYLLLRVADQPVESREANIVDSNPSATTVIRKIAAGQSNAFAMLDPEERFLNGSQQLVPGIM
jgi:hypothetical protein